MMEKLNNILKKKDTKTEWFWIMLFRVPGVVIFFLPFVPITISYIKSDVEKIGLDGSDWKLLGIGFFLVWGSQFFGVIANKIGVAILKKLGIDP